METQSTLNGGDAQDDDKELHAFGVQTVRSNNNLTITDAAEYAGVTAAPPSEVNGDEVSYETAALSLDPDYADGIVAAVLISNPNADGRRSNGIRPLKRAGSEPPQHSLSVCLSPDAFETLGIDPDDPRGEDVSIVAGEHFIGFTRPDVGISTLADINPQAVRAEYESDGATDPLNLLAPVMADDFRAVELDRRHPQVVAAERGVTVWQVVRNVRRARDRLRDHVEQGHDVDYDFDNPNVPDAREGSAPRETASSLPTEDMDDGELRAKVHSLLTQHLTEHSETELAAKVNTVVGEVDGDMGDEPDYVAETFINETDREELVDIFLMLNARGETASETVTGGDNSE